MVVDLLTFKRWQGERDKVAGFSIFDLYFMFLSLVTAMPDLNTGESFTCGAELDYQISSSCWLNANHGTIMCNTLPNSLTA